MTHVIASKLDKWKEDLVKERKVIQNQLQVAEEELAYIEKKLASEEMDIELKRKLKRFEHYRDQKQARLMNIDVLIDEIDINRHLRS